MQTQRWNGASAGVVGNVTQMNCTYNVPLDTEIGQMPQNGTHQCRYIYCDMHLNNWQGSDAEWSVFGQFVPQLMRGFCTAANTTGFGIKDVWLDRWYVRTDVFLLNRLSNVVALLLVGMAQ